MSYMTPEDEWYTHYCMWVLTPYIIHDTQRHVTHSLRAIPSSPHALLLLAQMCVGCQKVLCICVFPQRIICEFSHPISYMCDTHPIVWEFSHPISYMIPEDTWHALLLQCTVVWCNVLQYAAVCCSVWQCAAVCCSVLQCAAVCCSVLQCAAVCCRVLQCAAVCCRVSNWYGVATVSRIDKIIGLFCKRAL